MENLVQPRIETCYSCHRAQARPRINQTRTATEIVVEALWCCPNCGSTFKRGTIERRPIPNVPAQK